MKLRNWNNRNNESFPLGDLGANNAWKLPDTVFPNGLTGQEAREACRALKGSPLRIEIYALDGSDKEAIPYTVEEKSYHLQCLQRKGENRHGVFLTLPQEDIAFNCERELSDPRIVHTLNLEYDDYGNLLKQATVAYKRLSGNTQGQNKTWVSLQENTYYELKPTDNFHLTGVPVETINYEIESFVNTTTKLNISDFQNVATKKIQHQQNFYYVERNGMLEVGDLGEIDKHALQYRSETLAFTDDIITNFCSLNSQSNAPTANEIETILRQNGYEEKDNQFWMPSQALSYDKNSFYLPVQQIDPLGNITELTYDTYSLLPISVTDPLQFTTTVQNDYRCLQPVKITDPNGNVTQIAVNTLGLVTKQAINNGKADNAIDFEGDTLDSPTIEYTYYLDNWVQNSQPAFVVTKAKKEHGNTADFVESYEYTDGLGRLALLKATAEDGEAYNSDGNIIQTTTRFVASGRTVYNNKGNIVKQYEPWGCVPYCRYFFF